MVARILFADNLGANTTPHVVDTIKEIEKMEHKGSLYRPHPDVDVDENGDIVLSEKCPRCGGLGRLTKSGRASPAIDARMGNCKQETFEYLIEFLAQKIYENRTVRRKRIKHHRSKYYVGK